MGTQLKGYNAWGRGGRGSDDGTGLTSIVVRGRQQEVRKGFTTIYCIKQINNRTVLEEILLFSSLPKYERPWIACMGMLGYRAAGTSSGLNKPASNRARRGIVF